MKSLTEVFKFAIFVFKVPISLERLSKQVFRFVILFLVRVLSGIVRVDPFIFETLSVLAQPLPS